MASCHSKFAVYEVINCRTIVRVHLRTYIENVNTRDYGTLFVLGKIYYRMRKFYIFYFMLAFLYLAKKYSSLALWPKYDNNKSMIIMSLLL